MAYPSPAIEEVLKNEGGYSNNPEDAGGETKYGISKAAFPDLDIKNLTLDQAKDIYLKFYWHYDALISQRVANKLFDLTVNIGQTHAVRLLQLALGAIQAGPIVADGKWGAQTMEAANAADENRIMDELKARACVYYADLNQPNFLLGWVRRVIRG